MLDFTYFKFVKTVGMGTFGKVYLVNLINKEKPENLFALKVMNKRDLLKMRQVHHVHNEQRLMTMCRNHPFIVKLQLTFKTQDHFCMLMEYIPGGELFTWLKRYKRFTASVIKFYSAQLCIALKFLHDKNVVYRDLKPENIMLNKDGYIKLTDLGFAKELNYLTYTVCGTPEYLAPEQLKGDGYGVEVDFWSLGIVLYEMAIGIPPYYADSALQIYEKIIKNDYKVPSYVQPDLADLICSLLVKNKESRLGYKNGVSDIMNHRFFIGTDWESIFNKEICPPIFPHLKAIDDTSNFLTYTEAPKQESDLKNPYTFYKTV
ncbi:hypothetical protein GVAV_001437 [Gurleya vavrai]